MCCGGRGEKGIDRQCSNGKDACQKGYLQLRRFKSPENRNGLFGVCTISPREPPHMGKYQRLLTRAKMKKSRTALTEPVERSILTISTHLPFIGGGLSSSVGPSQNRRTGVL